MLSVGEGTGLYLCIAQVSFEGSSMKVFYAYMYMYVSFMHESMALNYLYGNMHNMSSILSIDEVLF